MIEVFSYVVIAGICVPAIIVISLAALDAIKENKKLESRRRMKQNSAKTM